MENKILEEVFEERDLGVILQYDLKVNKQCVKAVNTANRVLGMIKRSFSHLTKPVLIMYKSLARLHLEYCIQAWRPHFKID